jgi:hypothetical protein
MYLPINLPRKKRGSGKNIRISYFFMGYARYPESRLEAEVYKFKGFTVNLFINKALIG